MVLLRNGKNTQEHQVAFTQAKAHAKAEAKAAMLAEAEAEAKAKATKVQDWIVASAEANAKATKVQDWIVASAEANAEPMTKAEYNAYMSLARANASVLLHLNSRADEILVKKTVGLITITKLVQDYRTHGFPVPSFLIDTIVNGVKKLPTMVYPEVKPAATAITATEPFANEPKRTTEPCKCEEYDRWTDHAWYEMHVGSGKCTAYKPWR